MYRQLGQHTILALSLLIASSCVVEVKDKIKKAKQGVSNVTTIAEKAQEAKEDIEKLKDAIPLTNEQMKEWLPESVGGLERSGFKVGTAGYANLASVEGTYKIQHADPSVKNQEDKKLIVNIIDGAGPTGSILISGLGMASKMNMENEDENKHIEAVNVDGIRAQQTFHKKRNETALQFVYDKRFGVMANGVNMDPEETWIMVGQLELKDLKNRTK